MVRVPLLLFISSVLLTAAPQAWAATAKLHVTPEIVAQTVLRQGPRAIEIGDLFLEKKLATAEVRVRYDWMLNIETDFEKDNSEVFYPLPSPSGANFQRYYTTLELKKPFSSGTVVKLDYTRISQKADLVLGSPNPFGVLPNETQDAVGLKIEQSLLRNFFGRKDRAEIDQADLQYQADDLMRLEQTQKLVLQSLHAFWDAYVAQESFQEAMASRARYKTLIAQVTRKTAEGYGRSGELAQAKAEYESQDQNVKLSSLEYLKRLDDLVTLMKLPRDTDIELDVSAETPPVPELPKVSPEDLRVIKAEELRLKSAEKGVGAARSDAYPDINFVGEAFSSGLGQTSNGSLSALTSGSHPRYYAGLKFSYHFGANVQSARILNRQTRKDLEKTRLVRKKMERLDALAQAHRKVETEYAVVQSAKRQKTYRQKAVHDLSRSYNIGRTDIRLLIDAINGLYSTEIGLWKAVGDYQIALNEWAATRDELIPDDSAPALAPKGDQ